MYIRITVDGISVDVGTKKRCSNKQWNVAGRVDRKTDFAKSINNYLDVLQRKVYKSRKLLMEDDKLVSAENIKMLLQGKKISQHKYMLMEIFKHHNEQMKVLVGREYAPGTFERSHPVKLTIFLDNITVMLLMSNIALC